MAEYTKREVLVDWVKNPGWHLKRRACIALFGEGNCPHIAGIGESWGELLAAAIMVPMGDDDRG